MVLNNICSYPTPLFFNIYLLLWNFIQTIYHNVTKQCSFLFLLWSVVWWAHRPSRQSLTVFKICVLCVLLLTAIPILGPANPPANNGKKRANVLPPRSRHCCKSKHNGGETTVRQATKHTKRDQNMKISAKEIVFCLGKIDSRAYHCVSSLYCVRLYLFRIALFGRLLPQVSPLPQPPPPPFTLKTISLRLLALLEVVTFYNQGIL